MRVLRGLLAAFAAAGILGCTVGPPTIVKLSKMQETPSRRELREYRRFIRKHAPSENAFIAVQRIAEPWLRAHEWEQAAEVFAAYRPLFPKMDRRFERIVELLGAPEQGLEVLNLGEGVNSEAHEGLPVPTADGRRLYFTGKHRFGSWGMEDIWVSERRDGRWQEAKNLGARINTSQNESANSVSADGTRLIIFGHFEGSLGRGDNFYADKTSTGWGEIQHFPAPINSPYFDSDGFVTADGKAMLFVSDRPGGVGAFHAKDEMFHGNFWGNTDIYVCLRTDEGWSEPVNLGPVINTPFAERTPFLHPDGKTLYFSSDGHYGLGRLDVFKAVRLRDDSWTEWSRPVNLGKEINTAGDDFGYKVATAGDVAYFSAYGLQEEGAEGFGGYDIYSIALPSEARPQAVATITGRVSDEQGRPLAAAIKWENLATGENAGELRSNPEDGSYFIVLPLGANYGYYAEREGYYPVSKNVDLTGKTDAVAITEDIVLVSIKEMRRQGLAVRINNIFFDFDRYELKSESYPELNRLAKVLKQNPGMKVEIAGHTDDVGTEEYNLTLSRNRAQAVVDYLVSAGCERANLLPTGYGESRPVASNQTEEGRALNRRVEFRFVER